MINNTLMRYSLACKLSEEIFHQFCNWMEEEYLPHFKSTHCFEENAKIIKDKENKTFNLRLYFLNEKIKIGGKEILKSEVFKESFEPNINEIFKDEWAEKVNNGKILIIKTVGYVDEIKIKDTFRQTTS